MRYLGIDFGIMRMGLAVSGPSGNLAFPLKTIVRTSRQAMFDELMDIIRTEKIDAIVLGIPLGPEKEENLTSRQVINFRNSLERRFNLPVYTVDEALTSFEAEDIMKKRGIRRDRQKNDLDQLSAVLILETFLNLKEN